MRLIDLDIIERLAEMQCLYATVERPPEMILKQAKEAFGPKGFFTCQWAIMGQLSGHEYCYCSECKDVRLMVPTGLKRANLKAYTDDPPAAHPYCKMTPGCLGHMVRIAKRPTLTKRLKVLIENAQAY